MKRHYRRSGSVVTVVSGARRERPYRRYGCSMHTHRGNAVCTNSLLVSQVVLETHLLAALQATVFDPAVVSYTLKSFEQQLLRNIQNHAGETRVLENQVADLDRKIRNCANAIAEGYAFESLLEKIALLETEMRQAKARLEDARPEGLGVRMRDTRRFVEARLGDVQKLLNRKPQLARAELAKHIRRITLTPRAKTHVAVGEWNLLGLVSYGGAGGQSRTMLPQSQVP